MGASATRSRITLRLGPVAHAALKRAAEREGVFLSQYVIEAVMMRLAWELGESRGREDPRIRSEVRGLLRQLAAALDGGE